AARQTGLGVAISGLGGDELFAGYSSFRTTPWLERLRRLTSPLPRVVRDLASAVVGRATGCSKLAQLVAVAPDISHAAVMQRALFSPHQTAALSGRDGLGSVMQSYRISTALGSRVSTPIGQLSRIECGHYLLNMLLRDADSMSMAHALELRVPL